MNSVHRRSFSVFPTSSVGIDEGHLSEESRKLVGSDSTSFYSDSYYDDSGYGGEEEYYYHRMRRADNYYGTRQEYLRSYTFTREEPAKQEKLKDSLKRFRAIVWAVLCLNFKISKTKMLREKLSSSSCRFVHGSSRFLHESSDYISSTCRKIAVPNCVHFSSLEIYDVSRKGCICLNTAYYTTACPYGWIFACKIAAELPRVLKEERYTSPTASYSCGTISLHGMNASNF